MFALSKPFLTKAFLPWGLRGLVFFSVAALVWFTVWLWAWLSRPAPAAAPMVAEPTTVAATNFSAAAHLLGAQSNGQTTPPTVVLAGIMAPTTGSARAGAVVLGIEGQAPKALKLGELVAPGWVLAEIGPTHVVLKNQGISHRVDLPKPAPLSGLQNVAH